LHALSFILDFTMPVSGRTNACPEKPGAAQTLFSKLARSVLRRIRVASKTELADRIRRYIEICNAAPLLPHWRYGITPDGQAQAA